MTYRQMIEAFEKKLILEAVNSTDSTYGAAKMLGLNRTTFVMICQRLGVQRKVGRNAFLPKHKPDGSFASNKEDRT